MTLFLGVDPGGTTVKAAVFDARGRELTVCGAPLANRHPMPGRTERDPVAMWAAAARAIAAVLEAPGVAPGDIAAVCCTGHGNGAYLFDGAMAPSRPGIVSSDTRADSLAAAIMAGPEGAELVAWCEQQICGSASSELLRWLDLNEPEVAAATRHVLLCKDYVRFRLTGEIDSDLNDLSGSQLVHVHTGRHDDRLFAALDLGHWLPRLPEVRRNTAISGRVTAAAAAETGLRAGTPVVAGMMDVSAVTLASGITARDELAVSAGTWSIDGALAGDRAGPPWPVMRAIDRDGASLFVSEGSPTSATNLAWMKDRILPRGLDLDAINAAVEALPPWRSTLVYLPYIHGEPGAPRASFVGLGTEAGTADLLRACFEGVVFQHARHVRDLTAVTGVAPRLARLSVGPARSAVWAQMFADVLGMPVEVAEGSETGALGSAMCAAVAVGECRSFEEAVATMTRVGRRYEPRPEMDEIYRTKRATWERVERALRGAWEEFRHIDAPKGTANTAEEEETHHEKLKA